MTDNEIKENEKENITVLVAISDVEGNLINLDDNEELNEMGKGDEDEE